MARRVIIVSAVLLFVAISSFEYLRFLDEKQAMEDKLHELSQTYALLLSAPLQLGDESAIRLITAGLMIDTDVEAFVIRDRQRRVIDAYGLSGTPVLDAGHARLSHPRQTALGSLTHLSFRKVEGIQYADVSGTVPIGELELHLSPLRIYTLLLTDLAMAVILLGLITIVVLLTTRSAYQVFIGTRLNLLLADIRRVENNRGHQPVASGACSDELALVIEAYNGAHRGRLASQQKIREYQDNLEQQIVDRTLDLKRELDEHAVTSRHLFFEKQRVDVTLNSIKDAVFNIDGDGRVVLANPACEQLLGIELLECLGRNILDLLPHEDSDSLSLVADIQDFIATGHSPHKTHEIY